MGYHRLAFGARTGPPTPQDDDDDDDDGPELGLDQLEISDVGPELSSKVNLTFDKNGTEGGTSRTNLTYNNCDEQSNLLNGTFDKVSTPLNSTFNRGTTLNSTFSKPAGMNTTFEKVPNDQRKMSEDRLSSISRYLIMYFSMMMIIIIIMIVIITIIMITLCSVLLSLLH